MLRRAFAIVLQRNTSRGYAEPGRLQDEIRLVLEEVRGLQVPDGVALRAHDHRLGGRSALEEADALEEVAAGHPGRGEDHRPLRHLLERVDLVRVGDPHLARALDLFLVAEGQPALHVAAAATHRGRGDHPFRRAADAHQDVDAGLHEAGGDRGGHVAVPDQLDPRAAGADLGDQLLVAGTVEDDDGQVFDVHALLVGDRAQVLGGRLAQIDRAGPAGTHGDLVHVRVGRVEQVSLLRHGDHAERVGSAGRRDGGALERIESDVHLWIVGVAPAHLLADVEHRRLVPLAFADHDRAADVERVERLAHRVHRRLIGALLVPPAHQAGRGHRRRLGEADGFQTDVAIHHGWYPSGSVEPLVAAPFIAATSQSGARVGRPSLLMQACTVCPRISTSLDPARYTLYSNRTFTRVWL